jgi:hypothetical protein
VDAHDNGEHDEHDDELDIHGGASFHHNKDIPSFDALPHKQDAPLTIHAQLHKQEIHIPSYRDYNPFHNFRILDSLFSPFSL